MTALSAERNMDVNTERIAYSGRPLNGVENLVRELGLPK